MKYSISTNRDGLGARLESYSPTMMNRLAVWILALLTFTGGVALITVLVQSIYEAKGQLPVFSNVKGQMSWFVIAMGGCIGGGLFFSAFLSLRFSFLIAVYVDIHENGLHFQLENENVEFVWGEIKRVEEIVQKFRYPIFRFPLSLLLPVFQRSYYKIHLNSGLEIIVDDNRIGIMRIKVFGERLKQVVERFEIPWTIERQQLQLD